MILVGFRGVMELPQIFEPGRIVNDLPCGRAGSLARAVIDHSHSRMQQPRPRAFGFEEVGAMMGHEKQIDGTEQVVRASQFEFLLLGEIARDRESESVRT